MAINLIGEDIKIMRARYDEALEMQGIPVKYQWPHIPEINQQSEAVVDSYSEYMDTHIFLDSAPKAKTFKRLGWVVDNDTELPFLIHCSFNLPHVQKDSLFTIHGQYSELPDRVFRVTEITSDLQAPDHLICKVIPVYDKQTVGRTRKEVEKTFNKSNTFIKRNRDYRGQQYETKEDYE